MRHVEGSNFKTLCQPEYVYVNIFILKRFSTCYPMNIEPSACFDCLSDTDHFYIC